MIFIPDVAPGSPDIEYRLPIARIRAAIELSAAVKNPQKLFFRQITPERISNPGSKDLVSGIIDLRDARQLIKGAKTGYVAAYRGPLTGDPFLIKEFPHLGLLASKIGLKNPLVIDASTSYPFGWAKIDTKLDEQSFSIPRASTLVPQYQGMISLSVAFCNEDSEDKPIQCVFLSTNAIESAQAVEKNANVRYPLTTSDGTIPVSGISNLRLKVTTDYDYQSMY
jgi:hypothetical protein